MNPSPENDELEDDAPENDIVAVGREDRIAKGSLSLREAQEEVDRWIQSIGVRYFSELTNLAQLMEEVGELSRIISRKYGDQSFKTGESADGLADELGDVLFVLICLANQTGVDLTQAFRDNLDKKTKRDRTRHLNNPKLKANPDE